MKKTREDLYEIFYGNDLLEIFKSFSLKIFSLQNLRENFLKLRENFLSKSLNFSSKLRSHEDLH